MAALTGLAGCSLLTMRQAFICKRLQPAEKSDGEKVFQRGSKSLSRRMLRLVLVRLEVRRNRGRAKVRFMYEKRAMKLIVARGEGGDAGVKRRRVIGCGAPPTPEPSH